jgi:membrane associated rhomboid family serine protease
MIWLLAFGVPVERHMGPGRFVVFYALCAAGGAAAHVLLFSSYVAPLVGASGAVSGLFGGIVALAGMRGPGGWRPVMTLSILWLGGQALMAFTDGLGEVAWWAHIGGFVTGLFTARLLIARA